MLVLASSSKYRRELLARLRLPFEIAAPDVDERPLESELPRATALRLAEKKARAVAHERPQDLIIGSDQVADLAGKPIGKPGAREAALTQLCSMRGKTVTFHTAVCLLHAPTGRTQLEEVPTRVRFRHFSAEEAARYVDVDMPFDCAGSAKIEALGIALVASVESSDPTALIGLPLITLVSMLRREGVSPI